MKKILFALATTLFVSYGATAMKVAGDAPCLTKWNALTKNAEGKAMAFRYTKDAKLKIMERPAAEYLGQEEWLAVCESNKLLGH